MPHGTTMSFTTTQPLIWTCNNCSKNKSMYGDFVGVHKQEPIAIAYHFGGCLHQTIVFFSKDYATQGLDCL
jgi:hypothetical protein